MQGHANLQFWSSDIFSLAPVGWYKCVSVKLGTYGAIEHAYMDNKSGHVGLYQLKLGLNGNGVRSQDVLMYCVCSMFCCSEEFLDLI